MSIISKMRKQDGVYWGPPVEDGDGGHTFPAPVQIKCRWEKAEGAVMDIISHSVDVNSVVYVDREVEVNGFLYLGDIGDVTGWNPAARTEAKRITGCKVIPNLRATESLLVATI